MTTLNDAKVSEIRDASNWKTVKRGNGRMKRTIIQFKGEDAFERKKSLIPGAGMGLFTLQPLRKKRTFIVYMGTIVGPFTTEFLESKEYMRKRCRNPEGDYMMAIKGHVVDGYRGKTGAQFINDTAGGPGRKLSSSERRAAGLWAERRPNYNARIDRNGGGSIITLNTPVKAGAEIYMNYGDTYWTKFNRETNCREFIAERVAREAVDQVFRKRTHTQADGQRWHRARRLRGSDGRRVRIFEE
jgi:hypothetical protein